MKPPRLRAFVCEDPSCPNSEYLLWDDPRPTCDRNGTEHRVLRLVALEDLVSALEADDSSEFGWTFDRKAMIRWLMSAVAEPERLRDAQP